MVLARNVSLVAPSPIEEEDDDIYEDEDEDESEDGEDDDSDDPAGTDPSVSTDSEPAKQKRKRRHGADSPYNPAHSLADLLGKNRARLRNLRAKFSGFDYATASLPPATREALATDYVDSALPANLFAAVLDGVDVALDSFARAESALRTVPSTFRQRRVKGTASGGAPKTTPARAGITVGSRVEVRGPTRKKFGNLLDDVDMTDLTVVGIVEKRVRVSTRAGNTHVFLLTQLQPIDLAK